MSDHSEQHELECMRLAEDCAQLASEIHDRVLEPDFLASDVYNRALEIYFLRMAENWTKRAKRGPDKRRVLN